MAGVVSGIPQINAAFAQVAATLPPRRLRDINDAGVIYVIGRGTPARVRTILDRLDDEIESAFKQAGFQAFGSI